MKKKKIAIGIMILLIIGVFSSFTDKAESSRFNMSYIYFGNTSTYKAYVDRTQGALDTLSPSYFDIEEDGTLKITNKIENSFIRTMHAENKKVVPFLSNHWDRDKGRKALENREKLADEIVQAIEVHNLDGINVDLENLTEVDKDNYTDFVKLLREKLPVDKEVSIAVAANPRDISHGWQGSYDYKKLARYVDYLMIMTYDESYFGSEPGPVAGLPFVEASIKTALKYVPSEKIVLGIPFYGRYWNLDAIAQGEKGGYGIDLIKIQSLIKSFDGVVTYDQIRKSPMATITIKPEDNTVYVLGRSLTPGTYTIWYENEVSIKQKLKLVEKYNLKGTGSWSLGQELGETWTYYDLWLTGQYFIDTKEHWAKTAILTMEELGWMKGTSSTEFAPDNELTRAQAAVTLVRALNLKNESENAKGFNDVASNYWAFDEINIAKEHGVIKGVGNEGFAPDAPVTREQMTVMLNRLLGNEEEALSHQNPFIDVDIKKWSYDAIIKMNSKGIVRGFQDGTFRPEVSLTRAEMATLLNRILADIVSLKSQSRPSGS